MSKTCLLYGKYQQHLTLVINLDILTLIASGFSAAF